MTDQFAISIKGILEVNGKLLLRKNERLEYELLGGRLEKGDPSAEQRLVTEFAEESGIKIAVSVQREPWLYEIGLKNIIIVPFVCKALEIPQTLTDEDGGTLHWLAPDEAAASFMPQGYKDSITGAIPHKSYSIPPKAYFKRIPGYVPRDYFVEIRVREGEKELLRAALPHFHAPRDVIGGSLGEKYKGAQLIPQPMEIDEGREMVVLRYEIL